MKPKLEVIPQHIDTSIHAFHYNEKHFDAPWHYHKEYELTYITQSNGVRYVGNSIENFQVGDMVLIGSSLPHAWKNAPNYQNGASSLCVQWKNDTLELAFNSIKEFVGITRMLEKSKAGIVFKTCDKVNILGSKLMMLPALDGVNRILKFIDVLHQLSTIKNFRLLSSPSEVQEGYTEADQRIKAIFDFIDANYANKINIETMASVVHMTNSSFCKFFKNRFKKTFTQYLNEFRIHNVCQHLQELDYSVTQIATECGYENMSYFHKQFKRFIGMTPAQYRKNYFDIAS